MINVAGKIQCIALIVVWNALALAQTPDLSPLLPVPAASTQSVRNALLSGDKVRAAALTASLEPASRDLWLGIIAIASNDANGAIRLLRRMDEPKALGVAYYLARQHLLFREQMAKAIRRDPSDFAPYYYLGRHYESDVDNPEEAAHWFIRALERKPDYGRARAHLGDCMERLGRYLEAEAAYQASAALPESQLGLGRLRLAAGDAASALKFVEKALAIEPRAPKAHKVAARIHLSLDRPRDAVLALESAAALAPHDASIHYQLYRACQLVGDSKKAAAALMEFQRLRAIYGLQPQ